MTSLAQNPIYAALFGDPETEALFSAGAELDAMIRVEAALAVAQADLGVIPNEAGPAIALACAQLNIEPEALSEATARNGVPVPALVKAMREQMADLPHAQYLHWGATSQDIMDSGLALRLRPMLDLWQSRLDRILSQLGSLAEAHADLPMATRTYGQAATPTSFGAVVAGWGWPLLDHARTLDDLRPRVLRISLSGAAGTLAAMGPQGAAVRTALATALDLSDPGRSWHSDRSGLGQLAGWCSGLAAALGKIGEDLLLMTQSGIAVVRIEGAGASSTMPQKQNPVGPSALVALGRHVLGLAATFGAAGMHRQQRDGAAWFTEWLTLPQLCVNTGAILRLCEDILSRLAPDASAMAHDLQSGHGVIHAEALAFAVAEHTTLDRVAAAARVGELCVEALRSGRDLVELAEQEWPGTDWTALIENRSLGSGPEEARRFSLEAVRLRP